MGFRTGFVLASVLFIYGKFSRCLTTGLLYITSSYDYPLLFHGQVSEAAVNKAISFYLSMYNAPLSVSVLIHTVFSIGMVGIVAKLVRWSENDKYFGTLSLLLYFGSVKLKQLASFSLQVAEGFAQIDGAVTFRQIHIEKKMHLFKIFTTDLILTSTKFCGKSYLLSLQRSCQ